LPPELPLTSVKAIAAALPEVIVEVFGFGKAPLAISARCYHARVHKLSKDNCKFVCEQDPDGLLVKTMDGQEFLSVNGVQTLSHGCVDLLDDIRDLVKAGVRALRLSPQNCDMVAVTKLYREVLDGRRDTAEAEHQLASLYPAAPFVNGFLHALPGAAHVRPH
jgi:collagenase-like PrtC family protease